MNGGAALGEDFSRAFQEDETDCQFYYCEVLRRSGVCPTRRRLKNAVNKDGFT